MSRIGKQPIPLPQGVKVKLTEELVEIKGPKGMLQVKMLPKISVAVEDGQIKITRADDEAQTRSFHGLARALMANATKGVSEGWSKQLGWEGGSTSNPSIGFELAAPAFRLAVAAARQAGVEAFHPEPTWVGYWSFPVRDPMGNTVEISTPEREAWPPAT